MLAIRHARTAMRIARLRRVCALSLAAALTFLVVLSLPTVLTASTANAVGAGALRLEADAASDAGATGPGESAADGASGGVDDGSAIPSEPTTSPEGAESSADAGVDATAVDPVEPGANADDADILEESVEADGSAAGADPDESRGANGGLTSNSPGPEEQRVPSEEEQEQQRFRALRASGTALRGDDYPAKYKRLPWPYQSDNIWDEWNFAYRQCTSFVSWRLNSANGVPFSNQYGGLYRWGDAGQWADSARSLGIRVDTTPQVGAVAWSGPWYGDASQFGHVAWVADVLSDGRVVIEEYNAGWAGAYSTRVVPRSQFQGYIHIKDLVKPFTKSGKTSVSGAPMVNGTLSASTSGWSPAPTSYSYRWKRGGTVIAGATGKTYQPQLVDAGAKISVEVTANRAGYRPTAVSAPATTAVLMPDADGDGIDDTQQLLPWNSDVNGDGLPDAVGFGPNAVSVSLRTASGYSSMQGAVSGFGTKMGWSSASHPRTLVDVTGDGKSDVVGFANDGVYVATSTGGKFTAGSRWVTGFGLGSGWSVQHHPRTLADVTGDGRPDVVGFASDGVYVAPNTGEKFSSAKRWYAGFGTVKGWSTVENPRWLEDMNGDGKDDIVGINSSGVHVALSTGSGFSTAKRWSSGFGLSSGWTGMSHPRTLADVNGDGRPDVVGFASDGVYVALNTGSALRGMTRWVAGFGTGAGWQVGQHPRVLADITGDGREDVVGFDQAGVTVAVSTGSSFAAPVRWSSEFGALKWGADRQPRMVTDVNGDGRADVAAFGTGGVRVALSAGSSFATSKLQLPAMGYSAVSWRVGSHPRAIGIETISAAAAPKVTGQMRVGEKLTGSVTAWGPKPVTQSFQWLRDGKAIPGATSRSYTLTPADLNTKVSVKSEGTKPGYAPVSRSSKTYLVAPGEIAAGAPGITGTAKPGGTLQAHAGSWGPGPVTVKYQWLRNGSPIPGATKATLRVAPTDVLRRISVRVTGSKAAYVTQDRTSAIVKVRGTPALPSRAPFADVSASHTFYRQTAWMHSSGLSTGSRQKNGKPLYNPGEYVTRAETAVFLYRLSADKSVPAPASSPFVDIKPSHKFFREMAWMKSSGLSVGAASAKGRLYKPSAALTRQEAAIFFYSLEAPQDYRPPKVSPYADIPTSHKYYREITWTRERKIFTGTAQAKGKPLFNPTSKISRGAMAAFLYRMEKLA
ncbi:FG-GAP-like repeat-containing protein [Leucobacter sp. USHLN153]|uniref:FG-GAP-like repeat-containing protein n=1 Tax=Leucobacter sp. USHLN153 TaxID=3081268 RepID=UPI00301B2EBC